jgi:hypothetical protein
MKREEKRVKKFNYGFADQKQNRYHKGVKDLKAKMEKSYDATLKFDADFQTVFDFSAKKNCLL